MAKQLAMVLLLAKLQVDALLEKAHHNLITRGWERIMKKQAFSKDTFTWTVVAEHHCEDTTYRNLIGVTGIELQKRFMHIIFAHCLLGYWHSMIPLHNEGGKQGSTACSAF